MAPQIRSGHHHLHHTTSKASFKTSQILLIGLLVWVPVLFLLGGQLLYLPHLPHPDTVHHNNMVMGGDSGEPLHRLAVTERLVGRQNVANATSAKHTTPLAWKIVSHTYEQTYAYLGKLCANDSITDTASYQACLLKVRRYPKRKWPWWFQTLLRDSTVQGSSLHRTFHQLEYRPPRAMKVCVIEKVASSRWRRLQCLLNHANDTARDGEDDNMDIEDVSKKKNPNRYDGKPCRPEPLTDDDHYQKVVFLRDPLERFLSGIAEKCLQSHPRTHEGHCQPNMLFGQEPDKVKQMEDDATRYKAAHHDIMGDILLPFEETNLHAKGLTTQQKEGRLKRRDMHNHFLFGAYVDSMPISWNVHFFPQALYCDGLYRNRLSDYDVVGYLGPNFYRDLDRVRAAITHNGDYKPGKAMNYLFELDKHLNTSFEKSHTKSSGDIDKYYTAQTVRRALQYFSIDYVTMGFKIPMWAEELLQKEANEEEEAAIRQQAPT